MIDQIDLNGYKTMIFDFDGVILDSNNVKRDAIKMAVEGVLDQRQTTEFVGYFVRYNGVPRSDKVEKFVPELYVEEVLQRYQILLKEALFQASLIPGVISFIRLLAKWEGESKKLVVLSGGEVSEIESLLKYHQLDTYFEGVYAAPHRKEENLQRMGLVKPALFFGDSLVDYDTARTKGLDFVFVYGASNVLDWQSKIDQSVPVAVIKDFQAEVK